jgi:hypothetical protein
VKLDEQVRRLSEDLADKRSSIVYALTGVAGLSDEAEEVAATLRFFAESQDRRTYPSQGSSLARQLRKLVSEVDVPVLGAPEEEQ